MIIPQILRREFGSWGHMDKINKELNSYGIQSGFYNFDTNRFAVKLNFKKSLMLPINFNPINFHVQNFKFDSIKFVVFLIDVVDYE